MLWYWNMFRSSFPTSGHFDANNKQLFVIVRLESSIKTANNILWTRTFASKTKNINRKTNSEAPTSLQADRHSFWICIFTAWFIYISKNIESVSFLVFYFEGHYKWFLSNLKHPLLPTHKHTRYETDRFASKYIEGEIIIAAAPSIKYENTKWICIALNVIIMIFLEVVRI